MQEHLVEYNYLEDIFDKEGRQITIVYGMNQIGKSFLLKKFALLHEGIFFSTKPGSAKELRRNFARQIGLVSEDKEYVSTYEEIFRFLFLNTEKKQVLVIDEFHNLIKNDQTFFPALVEYMEANVEDCMICFVSSHIGFVENQMISKIGNYATSITSFLKMKEMSFEEVSAKFPSYSTYDVLQMYTIFGGQHGYIDCMQKDKSIEENICTYLLSEHSYIFAKMHQYIEEQLRETGVYYTILEALARGQCKLNDIYHYTGFSRAKISVYLKALMELEFVEKVFSVDTPGRINVQKGVYRISNPLLHFYFKFIYPNESQFVLLDASEFYYQFVKEEMNALVKNQFEKICLDMFFVMNEDGALPMECEIVGEWVGKKGTIPIVAKGMDENYLIGFCNDTENPFSIKQYKKIEPLLIEAKIDSEYVYLFSINGFEKGLQNYDKEEKTLILIDME